MNQRTRRLHEALLETFDGGFERHSAIDLKPLLVDMAPPEPLRLRVYAYSLVGGAGERARGEYKIVLRVPGQAIGEYGAFDYSDGRFTLVVGYHATLDVFVFWDATLHPKFKNGGNLQVREEVVHEAAAVGRVETVRRLRGRPREIVFACQPSEVRDILRARILATGGLEEGECQTFLR
jgi:hypothetical protein